MFQGLARDRLEHLNASPSVTILSHLRVYTVLMFVLLFDLLWLVDFLLQL
jgi:autocrine motility factor receptor